MLKAFSACILLLFWGSIVYSTPAPSLSSPPPSLSKARHPPTIRPPPLAAGIRGGCHVMYVGHGVLFGAETKEKEQAGASQQKKGNVRILQSRNAEDRSHITWVNSLWLPPDQPRLPALRPTRPIKGQLWRNLNTTGTDRYFLQESLGWISWEDCPIFEVETVVITRGN